MPLSLIRSGSTAREDGVYDQEWHQINVTSLSAVPRRYAAIGSFCQRDERRETRDESHMVSRQVLQHIIVLVSHQMRSLLQRHLQVLVMLRYELGDSIKFMGEVRLFPWLRCAWHAMSDLCWTRPSGLQTCANAKKKGSMEQLVARDSLQSCTDMLPVGPKVVVSVSSCGHRPEMSCSE